MPATKVDGRSDRSARTHEKIIEALFLLVGEGKLRPGAEEIAERADVAVRTLFRHFDDMEGLFREGRMHLASLFEAPRDQPDFVGTLAERARAFASQQGELFEGIRNYILFYASNVQSVEEVNSISSHLGPAHRLRVWTALPECAAATSTARSGVEVLFTFQYWEQLRVEQEMSVEEAIDSIGWTATVLLGAGAREISP